jgi:hypothetical protein
MQYIVHTDFIGKAISGEVNLPAGTECTEINGTIYHNARAVCRIGSNNACKYFARNNDGNGMKRGELIKTIKAALALQDEHHYERWHRVMNCPVCKQFDKNPDGDTWEWNLAFYNASIATLEHMANKVTDENWLGITEPTAEGADAP